MEKLKQVGELLSGKMAEIKKLPAEQQAEAIGKMFGQIEGMLATGPLLKVAGTTATAAGLSKTGKVLTATGEFLGAGNMEGTGLERAAIHLGKTAAKKFEGALAVATDIADSQIPTLMKAGGISAEFASEMMERL